MLDPMPRKDVKLPMTSKEAQMQRRVEELEAERDALRAKLAKAVEALTPSEDTKAAYIGEFSFPITLVHPGLDKETIRLSVPWTCIKEIMAMIRARATLAKIKGEADDTR